MKKQKTMWTVIVMIVLVVAVGIGFWQIIASKNSQDQDTARSKVEEVNAILKKDFSTGYPGTPREVVKMYSRINSCLYNNKLGDEDVDKLVDKMRELFDDELLASNPKDSHVEKLKEEMEQFRDAKRFISSYSIDNNSTVTKEKIKDMQYASLYASYLVQEGTDYSKTYEKFLLREDKDGKWKIVGWEVADKGNTDSNEDE